MSLNQRLDNVTKKNKSQHSRVIVVTECKDQAGLSFYVTSKGINYRSHLNGIFTPELVDKVYTREEVNQLEREGKRIVIVRYTTLQ